MITGDYIVDYVAYDNKGFEVDNGNIALSDAELNDASEFHSLISNMVRSKNTSVERVRFVGVFKL